MLLTESHPTYNKYLAPACSCQRVSLPCGPVVTLDLRAMAPGDGTDPSREPSGTFKQGSQVMQRTSQALGMVVIIEESLPSQ